VAEMLRNGAVRMLVLPRHLHRLNQFPGLLESTAGAIEGHSTELKPAGAIQGISLPSAARCEHQCWY
jgi:hypothetical protein